VPVSAGDFPAGFAETSTAPFTRIRFDLGYGDIEDVGIPDYGEFLVSLDYGWDLLQAQCVPWDAERGRVSVVARYENAVQLKWSPSSPRWRWPR
jgi:hypothetical protein